MIYKNERDVKLIVIDTERNSRYIRISNEEDLLDIIKDELNSSDYNLVKNGAEINVLELTVVNNNNAKSYANSTGDMKYDKVYYIYYKIVQNDKKTI